MSGFVVTDDKGAVQSAATLGAGVAPNNATYITQVAESGLSGEQALAALATGLVKNTTSTGVLSIAGESDVESALGSHVMNEALMTPVNATGTPTFRALDYLDLPKLAKASYQLGSTSDYSTNSTAFTPVDNTNLVLTMTTHGGDVVLDFTGVAGPNTAGTRLYFDFEVDGVLVGGANGLTYIAQQAGNGGTAFAVHYRATNLGSGSHTFKLMWKHSTASFSGSLYANSAGAQGGLKSQFDAREVL
jgi:hypothetical protein